MLNRKSINVRILWHFPEGFTYKEIYVRYYEGVRDSFYFHVVISNKSGNTELK